MTQEHFLFIPTVFFLGFFLGGIVSSSRDNLNSKGADKKTSFYALGLSFFIFISVFIATHVLPLFGGSKSISIVTNGKPLFDQRPVLTSIEFYNRLSDYGELGREMYKRFTYGVDLFFPLTFLGFLILLNQFIAEKANFSKAIRKKIFMLPIAWFLFDMIENSILFFLINQFPVRYEFLSANLGFITYGKFCLLFISITLPIIGSFIYKIRKPSSA
jgi:hypothetical protein